ncbi:Glycosyl hydrolase family 20, catalytic domain [Cohnella sp. OV330]|uniref:beta-N-acetylhexosaminidase n=1 Tax=Cohnella sp. OV330 TaxID=1855288 RepID=UPI0008E2912D|nr:beta-N-acetylhexosaminidase [Cohnella sp. OV330]SFB54088.1 Glycosyl hydrolase family 20, catalytic domain [Cohnella sp. OV330]
MNIRWEGDPAALAAGIRELAPGLGIAETEDGMPVRAERSPEEDELTVAVEEGPDGSRGYIRYGRKHQFFRGLGLLAQHGRAGKAFRIEERQRLRTVGPMFDLSRNAVLAADGWRAMLGKMALMGLNTVMLYMEDTYELAGEPYFGYMRGRYSAAELKEIDDYADQFGIEAFPSIQTLAHLEEFLKWEPVKAYKDTKGALLVDDERVDALVERMIDAATAPFRSRKLHIGMDEAEEVGRGKYLDRHGYKDRLHIMTDHLARVLAATRRRGLKTMMWSDMFLKLASAGGEDYYDKNTRIPEEMARLVPKDVDMVYWDYNHLEQDDYRQLIDRHRPLGCNLAFAGAVWIFNTFGVNYGLSLRATDSALTVCKQEDVGEIYATMWGDDGNESNPFLALLGLQYYAEHAYADGSPEWQRVAERVKFVTGIDADAFLRLRYLDETPGSEPDNRKQSNPSKFLLYQDVLLGLFDRQIEGLPMSAHYAELEKAIAEGRDAAAELDYLFEVPQRLCAVLKLKSEIGIALKQAYDAGDRRRLRQIAEKELPAIADAVQALRAAHRDQWHGMFKPFGWEVLDIRYGGVTNRLDTAARRLIAYADGRLPRIEELEQERLVYSGANRFNNGGVGWSSFYYRMATPNVFYHVLNPF